MQIALKSSEKFATNAIKTLAMEVTRLEIAEIKSNGAASTYKISSVDNPEPKANTLADEIVDKVIEKLCGATLEPGNATSPVDTAPTVHDNGINFTNHGEIFVDVKKVNFAVNIETTLHLNRPRKTIGHASVVVAKV